MFEGKKALILGVANKRSIAWAIAKRLADGGATLAFTFQGEALERRVRPLAATVNSECVFACDVTDEASIDAAFAALKARWDGLDFLVHAIGYADKSYLRGRYMDTPRAAFLQALDISCYSFTAVAQRAVPMMTAGGSLLTLTYVGAERWTPHYNVMGIAKAALEASVRYLASDFGARGIRVNAISAGPVRTLAGSGIGDARAMFAFQQKHSPLGRGVTLDELGGSALYLLSDLSGGVTGEIHYVDSGYNVISMPRPEALKDTAE